MIPIPDSSPPSGVPSLDAQVAPPTPWPGDDDGSDVLFGSEAGWAIRWGTAAVVAFVAAAAGAAALVQHPSVVAAPFRLTSEARPATLAPPTPGALEELLVEDGDTVTAGQPLAVLHSGASRTAVEAVSRWARRSLPVAEARCTVGGPPPAATRGLDLGELAIPAAAAVGAYREWSVLSADRDILGRRSRLLAEEARAAGDLAGALERQQQEREMEAALAQATLQRMAALADRGVSAPLEVDAARAVVAERMGAVEVIAEGRARARAERFAREREALDLERELSAEWRGTCTGLSRALADLVAAVDTWEQEALVIALADGRVVLPRALTPGQYLEAGSPLLTISPLDIRPVGEAFLPQAGMGRVRLGQPVRIRFEGYPAAEYGVVEGAVEAVAAIPADRTYRLTVSLPSGLQTTFGRDLPFREGMEGSAEVVTGERSLLDRLFGRLRGLSG